MAVTTAQAREVAQDISRQQTRIAPTGKTQSWLDARLTMDEEGKRMPTNADYDKVLVGSEKWGEIIKVFSAWTDSVLIYPAQNGKFEAGKDVVDAYKDDAGNEWVFSAASIPNEAIGKKGIGIHIDHPAIEVRGKTVILSAGPESTVTVLENFIQENGKIGKVDEKTRVPLEADTSNLSPEKIRWFFRIDGAGVRPVLRSYGYGYGYRRNVFAFGRQDYAFGVAQLETGSEAAAPKSDNANSELAAAVRETVPQLIAGLEMIASRETLERLRRLQRLASE